MLSLFAVPSKVRVKKEGGSVKSQRIIILGGLK